MAETPGNSMTAGTQHDGANLLMGLSAGERRLLYHLARFGFLTLHQASRLDGRTPRTARVAAHRLHKRGLVRQFAPVWGPQRHKIYALSDLARQMLRPAPGFPPLARAQLDRIDEIAAAADLALELEGRGAGRWLTWPECRLRYPPQRSPGWRPDALSVPPAGVLEEPSGRLRPVWLLLRRRAPGLLRHDIRSVCMTDPFAFAAIYAPPEVCRALERMNLPASIEEWTPPHLCGRPPLLPGWWKTGRSHSGRVPSAAGREPGRGTHHRLGPTAAEILHYLDRFGYATAPQVARACRRRAIDTRVILAQLLQRGLAQRHGGHGPRPHAWSATRPGLAAIGSARLALPPEPLHRRHSLALNDLAHDLAARFGGRWETEREVRSSEPDVRRRYALPPPDGRLILPDGKRVGIQLQLSGGHPARQYLDAHKFRARGLCDEVWFVCNPDVAPRFRRALRAGDVGLIHVIEWVAPNHSGGMRETEPWQRPKPDQPP